MRCSSQNCEIVGAICRGMNEDGIPRDTATDFKPVWVRLPAAIRLTAIRKTRLCQLIKDQKIRTRLIKQRRDSKHGIRLISYDSLMEFIEKEGVE